MVACTWLKVDGTPYRGAFRKPRDWYDDGSLMPDSAFRDARGRQVKERVPALGYDGSDIKNMHPIKGVTRFLDMVRDDGHVAPIVQTNASSHVPSEDTSYQRDRYLKAKHFGWYAWPTHCPCVMAAVGELRPEQLAAPGCRGPAVSPEDKAAEKAAADAWRGEPLPSAQWWGRPCPPGHVGRGRPPCIHAIAERATRRAIRRAEVMAAEAKGEGPAVQAAKDQAAAFLTLAEKQAALTEQLGSLVTTALAAKDPKK